jgi:hypothetical protein
MVVGIHRLDGRPVEGLVDVLHEDKGLADRPVAVEEHGDHVVHRVVRQEQLARTAPLSASGPPRRGGQTGCRMRRLA